MVTKKTNGQMIMFQDAGRLFSSENKKIQNITSEIKSILVGGGGKDRKRKRFRKKKGGSGGGRGGRN